MKGYIRSAFILKQHQDWILSSNYTLSEGLIPKADEVGVRVGGGVLLEQPVRRALYQMPTSAPLAS